MGDYYIAPKEPMKVEGVDMILNNNFIISIFHLFVINISVIFQSIFF